MCKMTQVSESKKNKQMGHVKIDGKESKQKDEESSHKKNIFHACGNICSRHFEVNFLLSQPRAGVLT